MAADLKMYCIFSEESIAKMQNNRGKMCAQAGHAFLHAWWDAENFLHDLDGPEGPTDEHLYQKIAKAMYEYKRGDDARKITLIAKTDDDLRELFKTYRDITGATLVEDCGYTIFEPGTLTLTCVGIGPLYDEDKQDDLRKLPLFT